MIRIAILLLSLTACAAQAGQCLQPDKLKMLDQQYEEALRVADVDFLQTLLAEDYVWVHNLAVAMESKSVLLQRLKDQQEIAKARRSHDITVHRLGNTAVLSGLSTVDKNNPDGKTFRTSRYRFMRTYVEDKSGCRLLAVQTMKVWTSE